jgi:hypothetical protein
VVGNRFELAGDTSCHIGIGEQRLRIAGRNEVELTGVVELADRVQRLPARRDSERERGIELGPLRFGVTAAGQQAVRMLPGDAEPTREVRDRKTFATEENLPNLDVTAHSPRW